ncbi:MAG: hypothetical protein J2P53_11460, partial [Bradyrhizobiaceae bacterium]|nr:hypothetical protein [Bradyrhizobiaceae bacterium]
PPMRIISISAAVVTVAALGPVSGAQAQQARKLFFEGDVVRHALPEQAGPFCVLVNQFKHNEAAAFRIRILQPSGEVADDKVLKSVVVELGNGQKLPAHYGPHGTPPTDYFWSLHWVVPPTHPTGSVGYKVIATMNDGSVEEWKPFNRPTTALMVVDGEPEMKKK